MPLFAACSGVAVERSEAPPSVGTAAAPSIPPSSPATAPVNPPAPTPEPPPAATGRATLSWEAPATRTDGTPLTNLAGYRIYYGSQPDALTQRVEIRDPAATAASIENLAAGTWYFAASAVDADGQESYLSGTASKTL